jgi:hypothetical protein
MNRALRWAALLLWSAGPFIALGPVDYLTQARLTDLWTVLAGSAALSIPYVARRLGLVGTDEARALCVAAGILGVFVAVTGIFNGQTFEGITTPRYAGLVLSGQNLYSTPLIFRFTLCAGPTAQGLVSCTSHLSDTYYVYLPLLTFAQIPFLPYSVTALLAWAGLVYLLRDRGPALLALGNPFVALAAANGYNDFPALLVLTLGMVASTPWVRRAAQGLSLGFKQFANLALFGYYVVQRRFRAALLSIVVSAMFLVPFALFAPRAVACTVLLHETANCTPGAGADLLGHLNYWLWPLWLLALFPRAVGRAWERVRGWRPRFGGKG